MASASSDTARASARSLNRLNIFLFLILLTFFLPNAVVSQTNKNLGDLPDSIPNRKHSPGRAALFSAVLPGLGQAYNKKYWKIPIVYAGFGVMTYFLVTNTNNYIDYQCAYIEKVNGNTNGNYADLANRYTEDQLMSAREYYRRNLEISVLVTALWYSLTILDAAVDAHLMTFDIDEDLSVRAGPSVIPVPGLAEPAAGIKLTLKF